MGGRKHAETGLGNRCCVVARSYPNTAIVNKMFLENSGRRLIFGGGRRMVRVMTPHALRTSQRRNPVGVEEGVRVTVTQGRRRRQPWADMKNPVGIRIVHHETVETKG